MKGFLFSLISNFVLQQGMLKLRQKSVVLYLKALSVARLSVAAAFMLFICLQLMIGGLFLALVCGLYLLPLSFEERLWILFGVGAVCFVIPFFLMCFLLSERLWYRLSGAEKFLNQDYSTKL